MTLLNCFIQKPDIVQLNQNCTILHTEHTDQLDNKELSAQQNVYNSSQMKTFLLRAKLMAHFEQIMHSHCPQLTDKTYAVDTVTNNFHSNFTNKIQQISFPLYEPAHPSIINVKVL